MSDPTIPAGLAIVAESVVAALANIATSTSPAVATQAAEILTRISTSFLLRSLGPQVARDALVRVYADLQAEIAATEPPKPVEITPTAFI
jgi:hypothetical protein